MSPTAGALLFFAGGVFLAASALLCKKAGRILAEARRLLAYALDEGGVDDPLHPRFVAGFKAGHRAGRAAATATQTLPAPAPCDHSWSVERPPEWRSVCTKCGQRAQGSCQG